MRRIRNECWVLNAGWLFRAFGLKVLSISSKTLQTRKLGGGENSSFFFSSSPLLSFQLLPGLKWRSTKIWAKDPLNGKNKQKQKNKNKHKTIKNKQKTKKNKKLIKHAQKNKNGKQKKQTKKHVFRFLICCFSFLFYSFFVCFLFLFFVFPAPSKAYMKKHETLS